MSAYRLGSLFSGIGGLELGFEMTGEFHTVFQVEIDPWARRVLAKHWPNVERYEDVRTVGKHNLPAVDVLAGGFPCQDISRAGLGAGLDGQRSGLWFEYARLIGELRPRLVVVENVPELLVRGADRVVGTLAALGYDAEWDTFPASIVGAPHRRERFLLVAYPNGERRPSQPAFGRGPSEAWRKAQLGQFGGMDGAEACEKAITDLCGGDDGLPSWMDRLRGLGNAVVPQVAYFVAQRVLSSGLLDERMEEAA